MAVFDFLDVLKLFSVIILGVRNFRVFEILEHLPYSKLCHKPGAGGRSRISGKGVYMYKGVWFTLLILCYHFSYDI